MTARFLLILALMLGNLTVSGLALADQAAPTVATEPPQTQTTPAPTTPTRLAWQRVGAPLSLES